MTTVDQGVWEVGLFGLFSGAARRFEDLEAAVEGADIAFVRRGGLYRRFQQYATDAQRRQEMGRLTVASLFR